MAHNSKNYAIISVSKERNYIFSYILQLFDSCESSNIENNRRDRARERETRENQSIGFIFEIIIFQENIFEIHYFCTFSI